MATILDREVRCSIVNMIFAGNDMPGRISPEARTASLARNALLPGSRLFGLP
jgi:hypothetical protein